MPQEIARQWFIPGDGIDRHVISADIQRYLGNDATVRPGLGTGENQGVNGYWIKAYRNLTSAMIADLRADSARWRQEQRQTGTREPYVGSSTYHASSASRTTQSSRRGGESPNVDGPYGLPPSSRDRIPVERDSRMQIDPPQSSRGYQPESQAAYPPDSRAFPVENRGYAPDGRSSYQPEPAGFGGRLPVSAPFGQEPRYAPSYPQSSDGAPPGYVRQGNYYVPVSSFEPAPSMPSRSEQYGSGAFGGQPPQHRGEPRDSRYQQPEYADPRFAYPSPATTVSSVSARDREPIPVPQQQSAYGSMSSQQYDQYARPAPSNPPASSNRNRASGFGLLGGPPTGSSSASERRSRR